MKKYNLPLKMGSGKSENVSLPMQDMAGAQEAIVLEAGKYKLKLRWAPSDGTWAYICRVFVIRDFAVINAGLHPKYLLPAELLQRQDVSDLLWMHHKSSVGSDSMIHRVNAVKHMEPSDIREMSDDVHKLHEMLTARGFSY